MLHIKVNQKSIELKKKRYNKMHSNGFGILAVSIDAPVKIKALWLQSVLKIVLIEWNSLDIWDMKRLELENF